MSPIRQILVAVLASLSLWATGAHVASAQQVDTIAVLRAIAGATAAWSARIDSMDAARCSGGDSFACRTPRPYPRRETWIIERPGTPAGRLAELLAAVHGVDYRTDTRVRPPCPWTADAPAGAGELVTVSMSVMSDSAVQVVTSFECQTAPGSLHRINQRRETWMVGRSGRIWKARHISVSET